MRNNNKRTGNKSRTKSNKNMSNKDMAKALKERDFESSSNGSATGDRRFNDPEWYVNSEQILKDVARVPYSIPVGTCFVRDGKYNVQPRDQYDQINYPGYDNAIPGILVSYLMPTLGMTDQSAESAVNVASNSMFQFVRSKISGSRRYEAVDMMIYMGAMDSLYCILTWLTRLYATAYTYHQSNKYLARAIIEAQNVDFDDLIDNLPNFRAAVNIELAKVRAMYLPSAMPIFKRHSWMFSHYFIEGDSEKDQIYFHSPAGYHYFTTDDEGKGALSGVCICHATTKFTTSYLIQMIRQMINPIFEREDFNIISGDLLKAYEGNVFTLTEIPDIATVQLTNSPEVLLQFKNAKYKYIPNAGAQNPFSWDSGFFNYYQNNTHHLTMVGNTPTGIPALLGYMYNVGNTPNDNAYIKYNASGNQFGAISLESDMWVWSKDTLLTTPSHDVQPVENMINTRLTLAFSFKQDSTTYSGLNFVYDQLYFGSEWPVFYKLFAYHRNKSNGNITLFSRTYERSLLLDMNSCAVWVKSQEPVRSAFKYLPEISIVSYHGDLDHANAITIDLPGRSIFEVDNYATINAQIVAGLHSAAILGEYNIPNLSVGR